MKSIRCRDTYIDLHAMIAKKGLVKSIVVLVKIIDHNLSGFVINHFFTMTFLDIVVFTKATMM